MSIHTPEKSKFQLNKFNEIKGKGGGGEQSRGEESRGEQRRAEESRGEQRKKYPQGYFGYRDFAKKPIA